MKNYISLLLLFSIGTLKAQDLIVTKDKDSLNCRITKVNDQYIYFTFKHKDEYRNTLLPKSDVKIFQKNFYTTAEVPKEKTKAIVDYKRFSIGGFGGWSYRLASVSSNVPAAFQSYEQNLKSGYHLGADAAYFISENVGFGIKYSMFRAQNQMNNIYITYSDGTTRYGSLKDDIAIMYIAPSLFTRMVSASKKFYFMSNLSIGYLSYTDEATVIDNFILTGNTIGFYWGLGFDYMISKDLAIGANFSLTSGALTEMEKNDGKKTEILKLDNNNREGLGRMDISVGLRWYK